MKPKQKPKNHRRIFEGITTIYIALLLSVFLFYCGAHGYQGILEAKAHIFWGICGGYVLISLLFLLECVIVGEIKLSPLKILLKQTTWFHRLIAAYIILTWISALLSPYGSVSILGATRYEGALTITLYGLSAIFISKFGRLNTALYYAFLASSTVFSLLCIVQLHGGNPFQLYPEGYNYSGAYIDYAGAYLGTLGNVDVVAAFLSMEIPLLCGAVLKKNKADKLFPFVPLMLALYVLMKMSVMAGIVGAAGGIAISLPVLLPLSKKQRRMAWSLLGSSMLAFAIFLYMVDIGNGMLHEMHELLHGNIDPNFGSGRIYIWSEVLQRIPDHLWFGTGPDTMFLVGIDGFSRYDSLHGIDIISQIDVAHNEYLNVLFHQGVFALIAYMALLVTVFQTWLVSSSSHSATAIVGAAALGYCIQAFFGFSMCITAPFFWLLLGLINGPDNNDDGGIQHEK